MSKFQEWANRHTTIFGFNDSDYSMVLSWEGLFAAAGYTPEELTDATDFLSREPPAWPRDHLKAVQDRIKSVRAQSARKADEVDTWKCDDCHGSGFIVVPHPRHVRGDDWVPHASGGCAAHYHTAAILCHCFRGTSKTQKTSASMAYAAYNAANPNWRRQLAEREQEQREATALIPADPKWSALMDRMTATMKAKRAEEHR